MNIITLNTWGGRIKEPIFDFFKEKNKETDIFCLQEIYHSAKGKETNPKYTEDNLDLFNDLTEILKETHDGYFNPAVSDYYGLASFIKKEIKIKDKGEIIIHPGIEKNYQQHARNMQYFIIDHNNKDFLICNLHGLWNGQGKTDTEDRLNQSNNIKLFLDKRSENIILCGDFNLLPETKSIQILENNLINLIKVHNIKSTRSSFYKKPLKHADYIFVGSNIKVNKFEVLQDEISDHLPLRLDFE